MTNCANDFPGWPDERYLIKVILVPSADRADCDPVVDDMSNKLTILAAYTCGTCDIQGRDLEESPGLVYCWNCGGPAVITARVSE